MSKKTKQYTRYIRDPKLEPYIIQLDDYCYAVHKEIIAEESGIPYQQNVGYYANFNQALKAIAKAKTKSNNYDSVNEFLATYEKITNEINSLTYL